MSRRKTIAVMFAIDVDADAADATPAVEEGPDAMTGIETRVWRQLNLGVGQAMTRLNLDRDLDARLTADIEVTTEYTYNTEGTEF